jgi:hypothetical protein
MPIPIPSPWRGGGLSWLVQRFPKEPLHRSLDSLIGVGIGIGIGQLE